MDPTGMIGEALGAALQAEDNRNPHARGDWACFNTGSVEAETGEFLYGLARLLKPRLVLETGTYRGVSAAYVGLALRANGMGRLITLEISPQLCEQARGLMGRLGVSDRVRVVNRDAATFEPEGEIDLLFLDSEPQYRFSEFDRFYPRVAPGGVVVIHDLHWHLGLTWYRNNGMDHWPYGDFREHEVGRRLLSHEVQALPFFTPRGLALFQKAHPDFVHPRFLAGTLEEKELWP